jgi:hypothetical protein
MPGEPKMPVGWQSFARHPCIAMAGLFLVSMIPLAVTPILPLIDFYNHLARFYVLSHISSNAFLQNYYQAHWTLLPDLGVDALGAPLLTFMPAMIAGHLIAVAVLAVIFSGVLYLNRVLTGQKSFLVALLLLPLSYSYILNYGFVNFLLGLGFAFWAAGWWISNRYRPGLAIPISCLISVLIFLTHGVAFALYGILVVSLEVGLFLQGSVRRPRDLALSLFRVSIQAFLPIAFFAYWALALKHVPGASSPELTALAIQKGIVNSENTRLSVRIAKRLVPILRVEEGPTYWFDILTFFIQVAIVGWLLLKRRVVIVRSAWPLMVAATLTVGIGLPGVLGVAYITDRMPLFAALSLLGALSLRPTKQVPGIAVVYGVLVVVIVARLTAVTIDWDRYDPINREFHSIAAKIPPGSLIKEVTVGNLRHVVGIPRCYMYSSLLVIQYRQASPLFAQGDQHPLLITGKLRDAVDALDKSFPFEEIDDYNRYMVTAAASGFDYVLVCNRHLLTHPLPGDLEVIAETPHFALLTARR